MTVKSVSLHIYVAISLSIYGQDLQVIIIQNMIWGLSVSNYIQQESHAGCISKVAHT